MKKLFAFSGFKSILRTVVLVMALIMIMAVVTADSSADSDIPRQIQPEWMPANPYYRCRFYKEKDFLRDAARAEAMQTIGGRAEGVAEGRIRGGIVPHHLVAGHMIADFFNILSGQYVEKIILIGPNHYLKGSRVIVSDLNWQTPFGMLRTDNSPMDELVRRGYAELNRDAVGNDHSIAALIPYIKYYLPEAKLAAMMLYPDLTAAETENIAKLLCEAIGDRDVIVASVDFSHYLTVDEAMEKDEVTLNAIKSRDYARLLKMGNEYLDSPPSIVTLLKAMDSIGAGEMTMLHHSNSAAILKRNLDETTGYFTTIFH